MAKLGRMQISGIRNFGPNEEDAAKIKFSSPLTLFLGQNGCGKTTIIESLKFACTGDVPAGSNSGQGFIHDPKINSSVVTKGKVKLKILDPKGNEVTVIKCAQVKQERDKVKFSTLDSTISIKKPNGEIEPLSSRCLDIGQTICQIMGVSKPILNYVIFCHQEDSLWPLDEGKALKEKFDKIFDVDNYNKCIESMRKIVKDKNTALKVLKSEVDHKQDLKDIVEKDRADLENKKRKLETFDNDITSKRDTMKPIYENVQEILKKENNICTLESEIAEKKSRKKYLVEQQKTILDNIETEFEGDDEELSKAINDFQKNCDEDNDKIEKFNKEKEKINRCKEDMQKKISKTQEQVGQLKESKQQHEDRILERSNTISSAARNLKINVVEDIKDDEVAFSVIKTLQSALEKSKTELDTMISECESEEKNLQVGIDNLREKTAQIKQEIKSKEEQIKDCKTKAHSINNQLHDLDVSDGLLKSFKTKLGNIERDLQTLQKNFNMQTPELIEKENQNIQTLESKLETLDKELKVLQQNATIEYDIEQKKQDILKRESEVKKLKNKHADNFSLLFNEMPEENVKKLIDEKRHDANQKIKSYNVNITKSQSMITKYATELKMQKSKLQNLKEKLNKNEKKIDEVCKGKPFDVLSKELHNSIEKLQRDKGQYSSAKIMYEKFIKDFQKDAPCCPVCETGFSDKKEAIEQIIKTIKEKIQGIPGLLKKVEDELLRKQELYNCVLQLGSVNDEVQELSNIQIPFVEDEINTVSINLESEKSQLEKLQKDILEPQKIYETCNNVIEDAIVIDRNQLEICKLSSNIESLRTELVQVASNKSRQEAEIEVNNLKSQLSDSRRNVATQSKKLMNFKESEHNLKEQRTKINDKKLEVEKTMQGKPQLEEQLNELKQNEKKLLGDTENLTVQLETLSTDLIEAEQNKSIVRETNNVSIESLRKEYSSSKSKIDDILKIQKNIEDYFKKDIDNQFSTATEALRKFREQHDNYMANEKEIDENINKIKIQTKTKEAEFKKLKDNVTLRKYKKDETKLSSELKRLEEQRGNYNYESLYNERKELESKWTKLNNEVNTLKGQRQQLQEEINNLQNKLDRPDNLNAYNNYKRKYFELKLTEQITEDLKLYAQALEASIMEFHSDRMKQVNKIIREYWRQIYRGNDIDSIEIKNEKSTTGTANKRVYNYRVVQVKNGIELDMRGRCSAGQKVLACLIIRMALAETFSHSCGILALDEPTTNLDRDNIVSLSEALARIVNARQSEKNFQLLVITHDVDFLNTLMQVEKVSYYYKVSRNEVGNSVITREVL